MMGGGWNDGSFDEEYWLIGSNNHEQNHLFQQEKERKNKQQAWTALLQSLPSPLTNRSCQPPISPTPPIFTFFVSCFFRSLSFYTVSPPPSPQIVFLFVYYCFISVLFKCPSPDLFQSRLLGLLATSAFGLGLRHIHNLTEATGRRVVSLKSYGVCVGGGGCTKKRNMENKQ